MEWLKSIFRAPATTKAIPITPALDYEVPRYPPFAKGLPAVEPEKLLAQHPEILAQYKRSVIVTPEQYDKFYLGALRRFASYAHLLPASQSHHHRGAGGLLRHSMEVGLWSLQGADNMLLSMGKTPAQRRAIEPRWQLTAFLAGLCHDVGKPATDMTITNGDRDQTWKPLSEDLYAWTKRHNIKAYFLDWRTGRGKQHVSLSNLLAERIIGTEALQWIDEGGTELVVWLMEALSGNPGATNPLYDLVIRADSASTERDLKTMGVAMAGYELGVPIERHLMDIIRRLIKEGIWQINELGARVWNINGGIYVVWPAGGEEIAAKVRSDDLKGFPRTADGILDLLMERGLAFVRETGDERYWKVVPAVLEAKIPNKWLSCIRLRDDAMISSTPIAAVPGRLLNVEDDDEEGVSTEDSTLAQPQNVSTAPGVPHHGPSEGGDQSTSSNQATPAEPPSTGHKIYVSNEASTDDASTGAKPAPGKFKVDQETGEILGVESGTPDAKKQPQLRQLKKPEGGETAQGISKPTSFKIKSPTPADGETVTADGQGAVAAESEQKAAAKKTKRKKGSYTKAPELEFTGSVGELFLALADDLQNGAKAWGGDVRVDDEDMVLLRWPAAFANYGLTAKTILDECSKNGWIWVDQDNPFVKLVEAKFDGQECKALRLMPDPGDALLYHAKYNPELHKNPAPRKDPKVAATITTPAPEVEIEAAHAVDAAPAQHEVKIAPEDSLNAPPPDPVKVHPRPVQTQTRPGEQSPGLPTAREQSKTEGRVPNQKNAHKAGPPSSTNQDHQEAVKNRPEKSEGQQHPASDKAVANKLGATSEETLPAPVSSTSNVSSPSDNETKLQALIQLMDSMPASKTEGKWRYIIRQILRELAIERSIVQDRKDLNRLVEANAKKLQADGGLIRYESRV